MPTMQDLVYAIEANTSGLNQAFPALNKLEKVVNSLGQAVNSLNKNFSSNMNGVGQSATRAAKTVKTSSDKIIAAQKRQQAALIAANQKLVSLNNKIGQSGAGTKLQAANIKAFENLKAVLQDTSKTAADATLARAKYNAALSESSRALQAHNKIQANAAATQKASETQLIKQSNLVEQVRIKYQNLVAQLQNTKGSEAEINKLTKAFQDFEKEMTGSALSAKQFSTSSNKINAELADIRRNSGVGNGLNKYLVELNKVSQVALGPLSGVASRISALGALSTGAGLSIALLAGTVVGLGVALYKSIVAGAAFEKQMSRINAVLKTTGNDAIISASRAERVVRNVANATGEAQNNVREAATGLLTISGMDEELLDKSLKAAEGLALVGGASIQTSFRNLAQVIQDPAQGLQTLTQYGVKFNAVERKQIENLTEAGRKHEALDMIFKKLQVDMDLATAQANTLSGAWTELKNTVQSASEDFAINTGITKLLETWIKSTTRVVKGASLGWDAFVDSIERSIGVSQEGTKNIASYMNSAIDLYKQFENTKGPEDKVKALKAAIASIFKQIGDSAKVGIAPEISLKSIEEAQKAIASGDLDKALKLLKEAPKAIDNVAAAAKREKDALDEARGDFIRISNAHSSFLNEQQKLSNETSNLTNKFDLMKKALIEDGKSAKEASAILSRLRTDTELQDSSVNSFLNTQRIAIQQAKAEAAINSTSGAQKAKLQTEQETLNDLYSSGVITSSDYTKALQELADMGFSKLAEEVGKAAAELHKYRLEADLKAGTKELEDQVTAARAAAKYVTAGSYESAKAAAVLAKQLELAAKGVAETNPEYQKQINLVKQLADAQQALNLAEQQKDLKDQVAAAQTAFNAAAESAQQEAEAIAVAAKMQEMLNENVKVGSTYWNEQLAMVKKLVSLDFDTQSRKVIKGYQDQAKIQSKTLETMFMSERTRDREVALQSEINELVSKYGSLEDANAQKELAAFKAVQQRDDVIKSWQGVADAVDDAFSKSEDALVDFIKTGKADLASLASSIFEDFFRATFKDLIEKPLHDLLGKGLNSLIGSVTGGKAMPEVPGLSFPVPLPVIVTNATGLTDPSQLLKDAGITPSNSSGVGEQTFAAPLGKVTSAPLPDITGKGDRLISTAQTNIQKRIDEAFAPIQDAGQNVAKTFSNIGPLRGTMSDFGGSMGNASKVLDQTFGGGAGGVPSNSFLKYVAGNEGTLKTGYNTTLGYGKFTNGPQNLTGMTLNQVQDLQKQMLANPLNTFNSSAVGEYQIVGKTLKGLIKKNGLTGDELFTPALQDKFGAQLALARGPSATGLGNEWASLVGKNPSDLVGRFNAGLPDLRATANMPIAATQPMGSAFNLPQTTNAIPFSSMAGGSSFSPFGSGSFNATAGVSSFAGMDSGIGGNGLDALSQSASAASQSMSSLSSTVPQLSQSLTTGLTSATDSATKLATDGLNQASTSLTDFAGNALQNSAQAAVTTATQTAQMGITSTATAAQVQVLGAAATSAAAQMSAGSAIGGVGSLIAHTGGIVGSNVPSTVRSGISFAGAPRLHGGLHPNEFKAILKRGEGVFTEDDMDGISRTVSRADREIEATRRMGGHGGGGNRVEVHLHGVQDFNSFKRSKAQMDAAMMDSAIRSQRKQN